MSSSSKPLTVAVSTSSSPDMAALGLGEGHLKEAKAELALQLLAADVNLAYGGDLRTHGFTQILFQLVLRYTSSADLGKLIRVTNHLAWPVHIRTPVDQLNELATDLQDVAEIKLLECDGTPMTMGARQKLQTRFPDQHEWITGLTAMREFQNSCTDARILLGGQVADYRGRMPGIAEEALLALRSKQPLFLIGGFGGCTCDISESMNLTTPWHKSRNGWPGRKKFEQWNVDDLKNGLSCEENEILATTPLIGQIIVLVLRGVHRLNRRRKASVNSSP